jgi:hypothetical protein
MPSTRCSPGDAGRCDRLRTTVLPFCATQIQPAESSASPFGPPPVSAAPSVRPLTAATVLVPRVPDPAPLAELTAQRLDADVADPLADVLSSRLIFTYVRADFLDGTNSYGAERLRRRMTGRDELWRFGISPSEVGALLGEYGWAERADQPGDADQRDRAIRRR